MTAWWTHGPRVRFDPAVRAPAAGDVLVGLGDPRAAAGGGIALNHKGAVPEGGAGAPASVSEYVLAADEARVAQWRARFPGGAATIATLVVEDLSLDTCFALLLFAARLAGESLPCDVEAWVRYVGEWERGGLPDGHEVEGSIAALLTMLGHSYLPPPADGDLGEGLAACLQLLDAAVRNAATPQRVAPMDALPEYRRARAQLERERQAYLLALQYGRRCQLRLPLADGGRRVLVDALILEEIELSGVLKLFARTDTEHSWTRRGFGLIALYRPSLQGSGNDMTVSVDPRIGVTLVDLWRALEALEAQRWNGERPSSRPRRLRSYLQPDGTLAGDAPDQPWWDDEGRYTLLGAPKSVDTGGTVVPGTRLRWREDVLAQLWALYRPIPAEAQVVERESIADRRWAVVRWSAGAELAVAESPTFHGWLASLSSPRDIATPLDLPAPEALTVLRLAAGTAVVHRHGVTLFDDWREEPLDVPGLRAIAVQVAATSRDYRSLLDGDRHPLRRAQALRDKALEAPMLALSSRWREHAHQMYEIRAEVMQVAAEGRVPIASDEQQRFHDLVGRIWGLVDDRRSILDLVERVDKLTQEALAHRRELRRRWLDTLLAGVGMAVVAREAVESIRLKFQMPMYDWQLKMSEWLNPVAGEAARAAAKAAGVAARTPDELRAELYHVAELMHLFERIEWGAAAAGFVIGAVVFWLWGAGARHE